jgi:mono/diheme cytochrome c family protein
MCVQCHTPRQAHGELDRTRLLQGAPIPVPAPFPMSQWAFAAPKIAGLPGWMAEDVMRLLQTGRSAQGYTPRPPMPPFRMTQEDAAAVVAYLKSLP